MSKSDRCFLRLDELIESGTVAVSKPWGYEPSSDSGTGWRPSGISGDRGNPGKRVSEDKEGMVHFIGLLCLFGLMILIMFNDIRKLIP